MASFDAFLKIEGIEGETVKGEIQLESFSWGLSNNRSSTGGGAGAGKVVFQDFSFSARLGTQSPQLFAAAAQGRSLQSAQLRISDKKNQIKVSFFDVFISSYKEDLSPTSQQPLENVSLNFAQAQIEVGGHVGTGGNGA